VWGSKFWKALKMNEVTHANMSSGFVNLKTGEIVTFSNPTDIDNYNNLPWYKKLFRKKPNRIKSRTFEDAYLPAEFYRQIKVSQNYIEGGLFRNTNTFTVESVIDIFVEKNKWSDVYNKYFYVNNNGSRTYLDNKALLEHGTVVESPNL
jgi:hypothetical protein